MLSRRNLLLLGSGAAAATAAGPGWLSTAAADAPEITDDGLYRQPWFLDSFLELADDLQLSQDEGKRFAVMWELKGCPYCKETHLVNFARPDINDYIREHFNILQLNFIGSREAVDFDGEELSEKRLREKYAVNFTPTVQFFPETLEGLETAAPREREVARLPGYLKPDHFLAMFKYVQEQWYREGTFREYLQLTL